MFIFVVAALAVGATDRSWAQPASGRLASGRLIAVIPQNSPPTYFLDKTTGNAAGFGVDIMDALAERAGLHVDYHFEDNWTDIVNALMQGDADLAPLMGISEERKKHLLFTDPLDVFPVSFFVRSDHPGLDAKPGIHTVGVIKGSVAFEYLKDRNDMRLVGYKSYVQGLFDLLAGKIEGFACPEPTLLQLARESGVESRVAVKDKPITEIRRAIAVRKEDRAIFDRLNKAIEGFVGSPPYQRTYRKWYGTPAPFWSPGRVITVSAIVLFITTGLMVGWRYSSIVRLNRTLTKLMAERNKAEEALRESEKKYRSIFENVQDVFYQTDANGNFIDVSPSVFRYSGFLREELIGTAAARFYVNPDDRTRLLEVLERKGEVVDFEVLLKAKDNRIVQASLNAHFLHDEAGKPAGIEGALRDITSRKRAEGALRESETKLRNITSMIGEGIYVLDAQGRLTFMNPEAERLLGWTETELLGKVFYEVVHCQKDERVRVPPAESSILTTIASNQTYRSENDLFRRRDGVFFPVAIVATPLLEHGHVAGSVVVFQNITDRKRMEAELEMLNEFLVRQATTDPLTGISNRMTFTDMLKREIRRARRFETPLSLIMFDVDHFKEINDTYGHHTGDEVLRQLAGLVAQNIRAHDLFARWGGEEFMIMVTNTALDNAQLLGDKLRGMIENTVFPAVRSVTCSFGVVQLDQDDNEDRFTKRVDDALYRAKARGRNRVETA